MHTDVFPRDQIGRGRPVRADQDEGPARLGRGHEKRAITPIRARTAQPGMIGEPPVLRDVKTHTLTTSGAGPAGRGGAGPVYGILQFADVMLAHPCKLLITASANPCLALLALWHSEEVPPK